MATKMSDQIKFGQWENLPVGSKQRVAMEKKYVAQHHAGGGTISDIAGAAGHTLSHPFSSGVHGIPGYGDILAGLATLLSGGAAAPEAGEAVAAGGAAEGATGAAEGAEAGRAYRAGRGLAKAGKGVERSKMGKAIAAHPIRSAMVPAGLALGGLSAANAIKSRKPQVNPGQNATTTATGAQAPSMTGSGIMPLFMQSIMEPYLQSLQQQIAGTSQGYGDYMNRLLGGNSGVQLNPAVRQALSAMVPGQQAMMNLIGQSGAQGAVGGAAMDQMSQQIQQAVQAQQAASGMYEKYMVPMMYGGSVSPLGGLPSAGLTGASLGIGGANTPGIGTNPVQQSLMAQQITKAGG